MGKKKTKPDYPTYYPMCKYCIHFDHGVCKEITHNDDWEEPMPGHAYIADDSDTEPLLRVSPTFGCKLHEKPLNAT